MTRSKRNPNRTPSKLAGAKAKPQAGSTDVAPAPNASRRLLPRSEPRRPKLLLSLAFCFVAWVGLLVYLAIRVNS